MPVDPKIVQTAELAEQHILESLERAKRLAPDKAELLDAIYHDRNYDLQIAGAMDATGKLKLANDANVYSYVYETRGLASQIIEVGGVAKNGVAMGNIVDLDRHYMDEIMKTMGVKENPWGSYAGPQGFHQGPTDVESGAELSDIRQAIKPPGLN